jgi:hypothetical protein
VPMRMARMLPRTPDRPFLRRASATPQLLTVSDTTGGATRQKRRRQLARGAVTSS